jgi:hypothetical protein
MELGGLEPPTSWVRSGVAFQDGFSRLSRRTLSCKHGVEWAPLATGPALTPALAAPRCLMERENPRRQQGLLEMELGGLEPPTS